MSNNDQLQHVYWCPECRAFLSRTMEPFPTLYDEECPLDSNDTFHWECFFCGYSDVPANWNHFAGYPTPVVVELKLGGQQEFDFGEEQ